MIDYEIIKIEANKHYRRNENIFIPKNVSSEMIGKVAKLMAEKGYEHSNCSIKMIESYLQGYGLYVQGDVGVGKTEAFRVLSSITWNDNDGKSVSPEFYVVEMSGLGDKTIKELSSFLCEHMDDDVLIDDIGAEPQMFQGGMRIEPLSIVLNLRCKASGRTHITTNHDEKVLFERYGVRVVDRLRQFGKMFSMRGDSHRSELLRRRDKYAEYIGRFHTLRSEGEIKLDEQYRKLRAEELRANLLKYETDY